MTEQEFWELAVTAALPAVIQRQPSHTRLPLGAVVQIASEIADALSEVRRKRIEWSGGETHSQHPIPE